MARHALATMVLVAVACASEGFPPGGPEDLVPPVVVESEPADRAVNAEPDQKIVLRFDEIISEQQSNAIDDFVRVNPDVPEFDAELDGDTITLTPDGPMMDGVTYSVTVLPGLQDRDRNATVIPRTILFSVGGEQPITLSIVRATIVRDSVPARGATYRIESVEDSFAYQWDADSAGQVRAEAVAFGRYVATAWIENVRPFGWQETEEAGARDTFAISLENRAYDATYRIAVVDTTAPLVERAETPESRSIVVGFDDRLADDPPIETDMVRLYESEPSLWGLEALADTLVVESVRARRLELVDVERVGQDELRIVPAEPLRGDRYYRIEVVGALNLSGLVSDETGGLSFQPEYEGAAVFRSDPIPWPGEPGPAPEPESEPESEPEPESEADAAEPDS